MKYSARRAEGDITGEGAVFATGNNTTVERLSEDSILSDNESIFLRNLTNIVTSRHIICQART